jgi:hypothetical protein
VLEPAHHAIEVGGEPLDLARGARGDVRAVAGGREVDLAHRPHEPAHRLQPAPKQHRVEQDHGEHGEPQQQHALRADRVLETRAGDDGRHEGGDRDEDGVHRQHLGQQGAGAHRSLHRQQAALT